MSRHLDFDAAWAALAIEAPTITLLGETVTLPEEIPAEVMLLHHRSTASGDRDRVAVLDDTLDLLRPFLGPELVDRLIADGMGLTKATLLLGNILRLYGPDDPGEAPAPAKGAPKKKTTPAKKAATRKPTRSSSTTSSPAGRSSKRTGSASTSSR